jgi:hypothetical protein
MIVTEKPMQPFNEQAFEEAVLEAVPYAENLERLNKEIVNIMLSTEDAAYDDEDEMLLARLILGVDEGAYTMRVYDKDAHGRCWLLRDEVNQRESEAKAIVARKDVRAYLCPVLRSATRDVYDVVKMTTPILLPLAIAGTLPIPLNPLLFALVAVLIGRMGVEGFCAEYEQEKEHAT